MSICLCRVKISIFDAASACGGDEFDSAIIDRSAGAVGGGRGVDTLPPSVPRFWMAMPPVSRAAAHNSGNRAASSRRVDVCVVS